MRTSTAFRRGRSGFARTRLIASGDLRRGRRAARRLAPRASAAQPVGQLSSVARARRARRSGHAPNGVALHLDPAPGSGNAGRSTRRPLSEIARSSTWSTRRCTKTSVRSAVASSPAPRSPGRDAARLRPGRARASARRVVWIAEERRPLIAGYFAPTPLPSVQKTELGIGAPSLEVPTDEIAELYAEFVSRASAPPRRSARGGSKRASAKRAGRRPPTRRR